MATLNPILTSTPGNPLTYNPSVADTFSWIPVENASGRPLYARAVYSVNRNDQLGQDGFDFIGAGTTSIENYNAIHTITTTVIESITATNSNLGNGTTINTHLTATPIPENFILNGPIQGITIKTGSVIGYK